MIQDKRARLQIATVLGLVIGVAVAGIVGAFLLPTAINEVEGNATFQTTQDVGTANESVNAVLDANLTSATTGSPDSATIELNNNGTTESNTVDNGTVTKYSTLNDGPAWVGVEDVTSSSATFNVTYANDYSFSDGASSLWGLVALILVLALVLMLLSMGMDGFGRT